MIYWDTDDHPCQFNDEVKKIYDNEIKNNMIIEMVPRRDNTQGWVTLNK